MDRPPPAATAPEGPRDPPSAAAAAGPAGSARRPLAGPLAVLAICVGTIAAGLSVEVSAERAHYHGVGGPPCLVGGLLGDGGCPGCGLTRSTALVLQGRFREGWEVHGGGFVVAFLCVAAIPLQVDILRRGRRGEGHRRLARIGRIALLVGVAGPWLGRFLAV